MSLTVIRVMQPSYDLVTPSCTVPPWLGGECPHNSRPIPIVPSPEFHILPMPDGWGNDGKEGAEII